MDIKTGSITISMLCYWTGPCAWLKTLLLSQEPTHFGENLFRYFTAILYYIIKTTIETGVLG